jgi:hypothetical protein
VKKVFRSKATALNVFGLARPATNSQYESTKGSPSAKRVSPVADSHAREVRHPDMLPALD